MKKPTMMRLDPELIAEIEAYRVKWGYKTTSETTRKLIRYGLAHEPTIGEFLAVLDEESPNAAKSVSRSPDTISAPVDISGQPVRRGALPKKR